MREAIQTKAGEDADDSFFRQVGETAEGEEDASMGKGLKTKGSDDAEEPEVKKVKVSQEVQKIEKILAPSMEQTLADTEEIQKLVKEAAQEAEGRTGSSASASSSTAAAKAAGKPKSRP